MIPSMLCSPITCQTHNQMESPTTTTNTQYGGYLRDGSCGQSPHCWRSKLQRTPPLNLSRYQAVREPSRNKNRESQASQGRGILPPLVLALGLNWTL